MGVDAFKGRGLTGGVRVDGTTLPGPWRYWPLPLDEAMLRRWAIRSPLLQPPLPPLASGRAPPQLFSGRWVARVVADCWVELRGWTKGTVMVNSHPLGRYWAVGPQRGLFLPAPFVRL